MLKNIECKEFFSNYIESRYLEFFFGLLFSKEIRKKLQRLPCVILLIVMDTYICVIMSYNSPDLFINRKHIICIILNNFGLPTCIIITDKS